MAVPEDAAVEDPLSPPAEPKRGHGRPGRWFVVPAVVFLVLDLATKGFIFRDMNPEEAYHYWRPTPLIDAHVNRGVAWSMFDSFPQVIAIITVILIPLLFWVYWRWFRGQGPWAELAFGSIMGGALGNGYDRIKSLFPGDPIGGVRDFISIDLGFYHWPAFNIADVGITVGFVALLIAQWRLDRRSATPQPPPPQP